jgi:hypothetical protein
MGKELKLLNFKAEVEDIARWKEQAYASRKSLSRWIRDRLNEVHVPLPIEAGIDYVPVETKKSVESTAAVLIERVRQAKEGPCERRLPKGAWCKRCGRIHA